MDTWWSTACRTPCKRQELVLERDEVFLEEWCSLVVALLAAGTEHKVAYQAGEKVHHAAKQNHYQLTNNQQNKMTQSTLTRTFLNYTSLHLPPRIHSEPQGCRRGAGKRDPLRSWELDLVVPVSSLPDVDGTARGGLVWHIIYVSLPFFTPTVLSAGAPRVTT